MATNRPLPGDLTVTGMDQKSIYQWMANVTDAVNELMDDHATFKTAVDSLETYLTGDRLWSGNPALAIASNFDVQNAAAVVVSIDGTLTSVAASQTADTGTAATFPTGTWGIFLVTASATDTLATTWATNSSSGYADEATAIAALPAAPASHAPVGYVTVEAHATGQFLAGTDALAGGAGGDVAATTNYYNLADPLSTITSGPATLSDTTDLTLLRS